MNGTAVPLSPIFGTVQQVFLTGNAHMFVDEVHATRIYGPGGGRMATLLGLENYVLAWLNAFFKALAGCL